MKDKATAFINELGGQLNNKILCKASSHDIAGPKKKHVDCKCTRAFSRSLMCAERVSMWGVLACARSQCRVQVSQLIVLSPQS